VRRSQRKSLSLGVKFIHISQSPDKMRPEDSYYLGTSWISPAPSTNPMDQFKGVVAESFEVRLEIIHFEGAARLPAERT
jgi:hypothetical protein